MADVGVRELKTRASEIVRAVRNRRARYVITYRGRPVAALVPLESVPPVETAADAWQELTRLGEAIGRGWQAPDMSADILSAMRR